MSSSKVRTPSSVTFASRDTKKSMNRYTICSIFPTESEAFQKYPNKPFVLKTVASGYSYSVETLPKQQNLSDRNKTVFSSSIHISRSTPKFDLNCWYENDQKKVEARMMNKNTKTVKVQTMYRDSSVQTIPWQPDYKVIQGEPELLMLDFLRWGDGLPAGTVEVELIERLRMKYKWEKSLAAGSNNRSFSVRRVMLEEFTRAEWARREDDIQEILDIRLELLRGMLNELHDKSQCRNEKKLRLFVDQKLSEKRKQIDRVRTEAEREKRRLKCLYSGIITKYGKVNVFDEHADFKSELYCPLMRNGTNPKYRHEVLYQPRRLYKPQFYGVEEYSTFPSNVQKEFKVPEPHLPGTRLCIRETKWTLPILKILYEDLKKLQLKIIQHPNLRVCVEHQTSLPPTPEVSIVDAEFEELHQSAIFIEKILKGRAIQNLIFKGRERCRELINEVRSNTALLREETCKKAKTRERRKADQTNVTECMAKMQALEGSLKKLGGGVTGTLLDFLNKDLQNLLRERRVHAMILLIERLRQIREAEEAGRRQKEIRRRKEHDEIFKQVVKIQQDSVDLYLEDIITEGMEFTCSEQAHLYVTNMAKTIEKERFTVDVSKQFEREEYIAGLVHNFVIPEVEKELVRNRVKQENSKYLKAAHEAIFSHIEELQKPEETDISSIATEQSVNYIDSEALVKLQKAEKEIVQHDIQEILHELVDTQFKECLLKNLVPCFKINQEEFVEQEDEEGQEVEGGGEGVEEEEKEIQEGNESIEQIDLADDKTESVATPKGDDEDHEEE